MTPTCSLRCRWFSDAARHFRFAALAFLWLAVTGGLPGNRSAAATFTWSGASPNIVGIANNWNNPLNWQLGQVPVNDGTAEVVMPDTPRDNPNVNAAWSIATLTFQGAGNYSLNGSALTLNDITHNGTGTATFNNSVGVSGSGALWRAASGPITFDDAITGTNSLTLEAVHPITFSGSAANTISGTVILNEGTLIFAKSSGNAISNILQIRNATARWDAPNQVSDLLTSQISVTNGGLANFNGKNEIVGQLAMAGGGRVQSTGGLLTVKGQLGLQDTSEVDLGAGELRLESSIVRSGSSAATSRIEANVITLAKAQNLIFADDSPAAVELEVVGDIAGAFPAAFLQKTGGGTVRTTGANTYQGGTTIESGTLIVDNTTGSGTGTGSVTVQTGAMLTGGGAVGGSVLMQNGAAIAPSGLGSAAMGSLDIGALSMNTTSIAQFQFNDGLPFGKNDLLDVAGTALINGNLVVENLNLGDLPAGNAIYTILTSSILTGTFANVSNGARINTLDGSGSFVVNYGAGSAFNPNRVVLSGFLASGLPGDYNENGTVDAADYVVWRNNLGGGPSLPNDDTVGVGSDDYSRWRARFGTSVGPGIGSVINVANSLSAAVPEPQGSWLLLLGASIGTLITGRVVLSTPRAH